MNMDINLILEWVLTNAPVKNLSDKTILFIHDNYLKNLMAIIAGRSKKLYLPQLINQKNNCMEEKIKVAEEKKETLLKKAGVAFENVKEKDIDEALDKARIDVMNLLRQTVRPEFLNRVDEIIMFKPLLKKEIMGIVKIQLNNLKRLLAPSGIQLEFSDYALEFLAEQGFDLQLGARPLKRLIQKEIVNQLSKRILAGDIDKTHPVLVDVFDNTVVFRNEAHEEELAKANGKKK